MGEALAKLPKYQCHKQVHALKIKEAIPVGGEGSKSYELHFEDPGFAPVTANASFHPAPGTYYVVYEDGYVSYSPEKPFEEGYSLIRNHGFSGDFHVIDGKLSFTCHTPNEDFESVKAGLVLLRDEINRQLNAEDGCPYSKQA